ncbi:DUF4231 domain-containing protein [Ilyomonas limi]|uniref:DUF4231 domain-containing protein n=1 Tax=Ilyomonas limi TaxID=2575867 RepID=A0A4U3KZZ7_9BACT|nr:SLATT domain-containing protein [Ilyomonas limi]TKK68248.1 DUF4231 domain-containing protein [Ilyomonas limi]
MENQSENQADKKEHRDWHKISKQGTLISKFLFLLFLLFLVITATLNFIIYPYSLFVVGLEVSLALISAFTIVRMSTFKPTKPYDFEKLKEHKEPIKLLLTNINYDIARYEEGSSYYFNGVRFYKYSTIILAGISTIILGLDFSDYGDMIVFGEMRYTTFAKNIALIIGAIITVTTALMTYWNIEKYWLTNKTIVNKLRALRDDVESDFVAGKLNNGEKTLQEKIDEYKKIKGDFYKYWEGALADRGSSSGQGNSTSSS